MTLPQISEGGDFTNIPRAQTCASFFLQHNFRIVCPIIIKLGSYIGYDPTSNLSEVGDFTNIRRAQTCASLFIQHNFRIVCPIIIKLGSYIGYDPTLNFSEVGDFTNIRRAQTYASLFLYLTLYNFGKRAVGLRLKGILVFTLFLS